MQNLAIMFKLVDLSKECQSAKGNDALNIQAVCIPLNRSACKNDIQNGRVQDEKVPEVRNLFEETRLAFAKLKPCFLSGFGELRFFSQSQYILTCP
jgi:hypothetical protein